MGYRRSESIVSDRQERFRGDNEREISEELLLRCRSRLNDSGPVERLFLRTKAMLAAREADGMPRSCAGTSGPGEV